MILDKENKKGDRMAFERAIINGNIVTGNESYLANIYIKTVK